MFTWYSVKVKEPDNYDVFGDLLISLGTLPPSNGTDCSNNRKISKWDLNCESNYKWNVSETTLSFSSDKA